MINKMMLIALLALALADMDGPFNHKGYTGYSGEILLNPVTGSSMFYWMFNSVGGDIGHDTRPLIIWTAGGPGYPSEIGLFVEGLAPFSIDEDGNTVPNPATWALRCHILAIDFPYGTGFSYASLDQDYQNTTVTTLPYLYKFLQKLAKHYPSWFERDIYWFGEDYSGHFVPAIVNYIMEENSIDGNIPIQIKGIGLGNPWADGYYQTPFYDEFAFQVGLVSLQQKAQLQQAQSQILQEISVSNYTDAFNTWLFNFGQFEGWTGNANPYNMRYYGTPKFTALSNFLNLASTKTTFNIPQGANWQQFNDDIYNSFQYDFMQGISTHLMPILLNNMKVLIYHGQDDLYCNILGLNNWIKNWDWNLNSNFQAARRGPWTVKGNNAGYVQTYSNLTLVNVRDAGNWVGWSQPYAFRDLAYRFIFKQGWN